MTVAERTGYWCWNAELMRLRGKLRQAQGAPVHEVEACYGHALDTAHQQKAKSLELRAAMSLARLWQQQDKRIQAYDLLAEVFGWFTEGFDTPDLQDAKRLLDKLSPS
jgi:predicted ATPase